MQIIPFKDQSEWNMQITLTGNIFNLIFKWNALNEFWTMNILDADKNTIVNGIKIVTNYNLTKQFIAAIIGNGIKFGDISCIDFTESFNEITRYSMGQSQNLFYYEPLEFLSIQ
jgi:hypothetical protein